MQFRVGTISKPIKMCLTRIVFAAYNGAKHQIKNTVDFALAQKQTNLPKIRLVFWKRQKPLSQLDYLF